ncbi:MAG: hypothetical protein LBG17_05720 [Bacteroidales bacterium]|nr:hypothetical protein [Bacteroidales bacterium]
MSIKTFGCCNAENRKELGLKSIKINTDLEALFEQPVDVVRLHKNIKPRFLERIKKDIVYV